METQDTAPGGGQGIITSCLQQPAALAVVATVLAIVVITRVLCRASPSPSDGKQAPPRVPFWLPFFGHAPQMLVNTEGFLARLRDRYYPEGAFSLCLFGKLHHFVHAPALANSLLSRPRTSAEGVSGSLLTSNFSFSKKDLEQYAAVSQEAKTQFKYLHSEPGLSELVDATVTQVARNIADFVTFNSYPADQMDWERLAGAEVVQGPKGESFVEADLMALAKNFIAKTANCALYGTDFVENFPDMWQLMWTFDEAFLLLAAKVPGWIPWPKLQRARNARRRMLSYTYEFNVAMDKHLEGQDAGIEWQDLDNVSAVVKARIETFRNHGLSLQARAGCDLGLCWAMNSNANQLISWMLFELYRDAVLLEQVREEVAPYVQAVQPQNDFGEAIWLAPTMEKLDLDGLFTKCPLLKAAYLETLRVYTGVWTLRWLTEDVVLDDRAKTEPYLLRKGTYAHVPQDMHQFDPEYFPNPKEWHHGRHLKEQVDENGRRSLVADMGTIRPYGGGPGMCKGRAFAQRQMLLYSAIIATFYDMQPPNGQSWEEPKTYKLAATRHPKKDIKVWIRRRVLPKMTETRANICTA
ncbi:Uncharacterized protein TPAR_04236 [Tolypocladium paradoxum]|uniref:25-hydroxycholesterol 7-alpha-hydroxylase n=1 Tax=Tolypocladium paradoxum TaxID=94208 RepID=A0A2S4KZB6_9HYPO|nr:Uncharacterized protein TPAR_04236 [Tolypocladium paradoxum]